ncbi:hypothetical protein TWF281_006386 [Arthrobotrys megalospora]
MRFSLRRQFLFLHVVLITGVLCVPYWQRGPVDRADKRKRRDISETDAIEKFTDWPVIRVKSALEKRQAPTCSCFTPTEVFYPIETLLPFMAAPYEECDVRASTSRLCPTDYICACQTNQTSICVPTTVRTDTACGPMNTGLALRDNVGLVLRDEAELDTKITRWEFQTILTDLAEPSGQCGGTVQATTTTFWAPSMTRCPVYQACACETSGYSRCIDTSDPAYRGTACPNPCATVRQEFNVSLPPPSATAKLGEQCGGRCWSGPTNCPVGAGCFTEISPIPGAYAACATANPGSQLKIRNEGYEGFVVPVKARAIATRIYF